MNKASPSGADPEFPVGGGANPGEMPIYKFARFSQKLHEIKKILVRRRARAGGAPLDPLRALLAFSVNSAGQFTISFLIGKGHLKNCKNPWDKTAIR